MSLSKRNRESLQVIAVTAAIVALLAWAIFWTGTHN